MKVFVGAVILGALIGLSSGSDARLPRGSAFNGTAPPPAPLTFLFLETGILGQSTDATGDSRPYQMGGYGQYTGTAPSSISSATWSGCGGGSATTHLVFHTDIYGSGTYVINVDAPTATGTGCTLSITTNLGTTATSPPVNVTNVSSGSDVTDNIHNAQGWQASHSYSPASGPKTRVVNGAGWTPGTPGAFNPGSALNAYELTSGSCTSASSSGPTGTGGSISDGTCTWKYLSGVDYVTFTGFSIDAPLWSAQTYIYGQFVTTYSGGNLRSYALESSDGLSGNYLAFCPSTAAPTGVGTVNASTYAYGIVTTADGCKWAYLGDVIYSSQQAYMSNTSYTTYPGPTKVSHLSRNYTALLWNDAEYLAGSNHENNPIRLMAHQIGGFCCGSETAYAGCVGPSWTLDCPLITVKPADGEGFASTITTSIALTGYDATKGVAMRSAQADPPVFPNYESAGLNLGDWNILVSGIQFKSVAAAGLIGVNYDRFISNIVDGGWLNDNSQGGAIWMDVPSLVINNLIFSHGSMGIGIKYGSAVILFNTIVNLGSVANSAAIVQDWTWVWTNFRVANNAIYGFPHIGAFATGQPTQVFDSSSANNYTDTTGPDSGTANYFGGNGGLGGATVISSPTGVNFGATGAGMFVSPGSDWRPGTTLIGAGASYGTFTWGCASAFVGACDNSVLNYDTPDFIGTTRPQSGSWTVGVEQHP